MDYYTLKLYGFVRKLPIVKVGPKLAVASFSMLGDVEMVEVLAGELVERIKYLEFDYLVGSETKTLPLIYQMSHLLGSKNYVVVRQKVEGYMTIPVKSDGVTPLVLNGEDAKLVKDKKVVVVDDVISSGRTLKEIEKLMLKVRARVVAAASVLKQGDLKNEFDYPLYYLKTIPLIKK